MTGLVKDFFTECNINTYFVMTGFVKDFLQNVT